MEHPSRPTLAVVPVFLRSQDELDVLLRCLVSLWTTAPGIDVLLVDDGSPERALVDQLAVAAVELGFDLHRQAHNGGFSQAVNVGLRRALESGRDAVLVNADMEFPQSGWLERMRARTDTQGRPAAVVGARLLYPNGLVQHAGVYFSLLTRTWHHRFQYGPGDLPDALQPCLCPVTGALQLIRLETLTAVGLYDEGFRMGFEDVDYCLRVFDAGLECVYEPAAWAFHLESFFRGRPSPKLRNWTERSAQRLRSKYLHADFSRFVPELL